MAHEIDRLPREQLARMAKSMRNKARNEAMDKARIANALITGLSSAGGGALAGLVHAEATKKYNKLVAEKGPEEAKKKDPRHIGGVDLELAIAFPAALVGTVMQGKNKLRFWGAPVLGIGTGAGSYWAGRKVFAHQMKKT